MPIIHTLVLAENSLLCLRDNGLKIREGKLREYQGKIYQGISEEKYQGETAEVRYLTCRPALPALRPLKLKKGSS